VNRALPARYDHHPADLFADEIRAVLRPDMAILDVGSGRRPALALADRPSDCHYVGLDLLAAELERAPIGAYDEYVVADICDPVDELRDRFDLVVSWQVLEHVRDTRSAIASAHRYLRPGGTFVGLLSGRRSVNAVLNRVMPERAGVWLMRRLLHRDPESVFATHYDQCSGAELRAIMVSWEEAEITPLYLGASYFNFSPALRDAYLAYESWAWRTGRDGLATHYLVVARR
jgi:SAM-dependent methyltransferase